MSGWFTMESRGRPRNVIFFQPGTFVPVAALSSHCKINPRMFHFPSCISHLAGVLLGALESGGSTAVPQFAPSTLENSPLDAIPARYARRLTPVFFGYLLRKGGPEGRHERRKNCTLAVQTERGAKVRAGVSRPQRV